MVNRPFQVHFAKFQQTEILVNLAPNMHHINLKIFQRKYVFMDGEFSLHVCSLYPHTKNIVF